MSELLDSLMKDIDERIHAKDPTAVERATQLAEQYPEEKEVWYLLAYAHGVNDDMDNAVLAMNRLADITPPDPEMFFTRGDYENRRSNLQAALTDYTAGIELSKQLQNEDYLEALYFWRADVLVKLGRKADALADLEHVPDDYCSWPMRQEPRSKNDILDDIEGGPRPWKAMSEPLDSLLYEIRCRVPDDRKTGLERATQLAERYPDEPGVWHTLAYARSVNSDINGTVLALNRMMDIPPPHPPALYLRGHLFRGRYEHKRGNLQAALADFDRAIALAEQLQDESCLLEEVYFRRADVLVELGRKAEARADLEHVRDAYGKRTTRMRTKADILADCKE